MVKKLHIEAYDHKLVLRFETDPGTQAHAFSNTEYLFFESGTDKMQVFKLTSDNIRTFLPDNFQNLARYTRTVSSAIEYLFDIGMEVPMVHLERYICACGGELTVDKTKILESIPQKYKAICNSCAKIQYVTRY